MSEIRNDCKYTKNHEWLKVEGDVALVGISDHAQHALGDIVFVKTGDIGEKVEAGKSFGFIESVKAAEDLYAPVGGEIAEVNTAISGKPEAINQDPYGSWIIKIRNFNQAEIDGLLDAQAYDALVQSLDH
ncbi:MAG: glycine cleavage system protein GcvH [Leptonema illini]|jgi:glycine cleavage system H protein|uniref:Glycine cleavage system H protein n=1 Tax=Leptonema illini TaxID=183 RepID=A0A833H1M5_9LEPT|nr:MAG: glycine cleavage system protein GcvH [Leptonema illini]PKL33514.1 MAG: glycine cleavage system protein H [Spirochaetae bacterium HGW-Spirochaetae-10]